MSGLVLQSSRPIKGYLYVNGEYVGGVIDAQLVQRPEDFRDRTKSITLPNYEFEVITAVSDGRVRFDTVPRNVTRIATDEFINRFLGGVRDD